MLPLLLALGTILGERARCDEWVLSWGAGGGLVPMACTAVAGAMLS